MSQLQNHVPCIRPPEKQEAVYDLMNFLPKEDQIIA